MNYGFVASKIDGTEYEFKVNNKMKMPTAYSYKANLPDVLNQGNDPICVPCSISAFINWNINVNKNINNGVDHKVDLKSIYKSKTTPGNDGMTFKDAFKFLRNTGVKTDIGGATYDSDQFSMTLKVINASEDGIDIWTQRAIDNMPWFKDIYGKEFVDGRHTFKVVGYEWGKAYPIKCIRDDGKDFNYKRGIVNDAKFF